VTLDLPKTAPPPETIVQIEVPSFDEWHQHRHMIVLTNYGRVLELNEYRDPEGDTIHVHHEWDEVKLPPMPPRAPAPGKTVPQEHAGPLPHWEDTTQRPPPTPNCQLCKDAGEVCGYCYADQMTRKSFPGRNL
jgi:hypothetical protein